MGVQQAHGLEEAGAAALVVLAELVPEKGHAGQFRAGLHALEDGHAQGVARGIEALRQGGAFLQQGLEQVGALAQGLPTRAANWLE